MSLLSVNTVETTLGALLVGLALALFLLGASCLQLYFYFEHYSGDKLPLKLFVGPPRYFVV